MEKYMAFILGKHLVFIDSFQFTASSFEKLANNLPEDVFKYTKEVLHNEKLQLMKQKGVYPYDFKNRVERFDYQQLPSKDKFIVYLLMKVFLMSSINML